MEENKTYKDIELRSEEVQEVMNRVPPAILRYGIGVLLCIVLILIAGSALFRYPETVETEFTLTTRNPPAYIQSKGGGRLERLYVANGQQVRQGDVLAVIENVARTEDMLTLCERLKSWKDSGARTEQADRLFFRGLPQLGSVQGAYSSCVTAWNSYLLHMKESRLYETELTNAIAQLINAVSSWKTDFLPTAPIDGKVAFMQLWKENQYVTTGETMFVVVPEGESVPVGKALLPMQGAGKVKTGQRAVVRLAGFPEQEYGFLEGRGSSISPVPDEEGNYVVEIGFPEKLRTNYRKAIPTMKVVKGTAEIVIREQSLLESMFKN